MISFDTSFLHAIFSKKDEHHQRVLDVLSAYEDRRLADLLLTTNHVIAETLTLSRKLGRALAVSIGQQLYAGQLARAHWATPEEEHAAFAYFSQYEDKHYSFVDCLSFVVRGTVIIRSAPLGDERHREGASKKGRDAGRLHRRDAPARVAFARFGSHLDEASAGIRLRYFSSTGSTTLNDPCPILMPQTISMSPVLVGVNSTVVSPVLTVFFTPKLSITTVLMQPFTLSRSTSIFTGTPFVKVEGVRTYPLASKVSWTFWTFWTSCAGDWE